MVCAVFGETVQYRSMGSMVFSCFRKAGCKANSIPGIFVLHSRTAGPSCSPRVPERRRGGGMCGNPLDFKTGFPIVETAETKQGFPAFKFKRKGLQPYNLRLPMNTDRAVRIKQKCRPQGGFCW